ncbi:MAG TPA: uracil-DNA glycosylase family protein [Methylophilaceae bacterium]|nr:uracil-DNA glycosylase family protein [Methylophilaceae bacterium]
MARTSAIVQPAVIVTLGGVAAQTLAGKELSLEASRGQILKLENGLRIVPTYHPSFVLRTPDEAMKELRYQRLVADLALAANTADT